MSIFSPQVIIKNFISLCIGQYGGMFCNLSFSLLLTRLLAPQDFGLIASLLFYFIGFNWIVEWGWDQGFIAHKELDFNEAASTHLYLRGVLGLVPLVTFLIFFTVTDAQTMLTEHKYLVLVLALIYWGEKIFLKCWHL